MARVRYLGLPSANVLNQVIPEKKSVLVRKPGRYAAIYPFQAENSRSRIYHYFQKLKIVSKTKTKKN